jgi:phospholipid/cholesterol/gamma-HCH transport system substrate-binding protein
MVMKNKRIIEIVVGFFILAGLLALFFLAFKVSGFSNISSRNSIHITAAFDDIGDLKVRAPVKIAGVRIGEVSDIKLDSKTYRAEVTMLILKDHYQVPMDSSASIFSASLLGANYIAITPGFDEEAIKDGGEIKETHPAIILENLIGAAVFKPSDKEKK